MTFAHDQLPTPTCGHTFVGNEGVWLAFGREKGQVSSKPATLPLDPSLCQFTIAYGKCKEWASNTLIAAGSDELSPVNTSRKFVLRSWPNA